MSTGTANPKRDKIPHPATESLDLATIMRTLGDPVRLEIVRLLADDRRAHVRRALERRSASRRRPARYHLKLLREAGVTRTRAQGTLRLISLRRDDLEARFPGLVAVLTR